MRERETETEIRPFSHNLYINQMKNFPQWYNDSGVIEGQSKRHLGLSNLMLVSVCKNLTTSCSFGFGL